MKWLKNKHEISRVAVIIVLCGLAGFGYRELVFASPIIILVLGFIFKIPINKVLGGSFLSFVLSLIYSSLNALARLDCANNCDAETETSIKFIFTLYIFANLILFLLMLRARSKRIK